MTQKSQIPIQKSVVLLDTRYYLDTPLQELGSARLRTALEHCATHDPKRSTYEYYATQHNPDAVATNVDVALDCTQLDPNWQLMQVFMHTKEPLAENLKIYSPSIVRACRFAANPERQTQPSAEAGNHMLLAAAQQLRYALLPVHYDLGRAHLGALLRVQDPDSDLMLHTYSCRAGDVLHACQLSAEDADTPVVLLSSCHVLAPFLVMFRSDLQYVFDFVWPVVSGQNDVHTPPFFVLVLPRAVMQQLIQAATRFLQDLRALVQHPTEPVLVRTLERSFPSGSTFSCLWQRLLPALPLITRPPSLPENLYTATGSKLQSYCALSTPTDQQLIVAPSAHVQRYLMARMYQQQLSVTDAKRVHKPEHFMTWCAGYMSAKQAQEQETASA